MIHTKSLLEDWKATVLNNDNPCSSGVFKYLSKWVLWVLHSLLGTKKRNYKCICAQHDFDYRYGWKYGISKDTADQYFRGGIIASKHPKIAECMYYAVHYLGDSSYRVGPS